MSQQHNHHKALFAPFKQAYYEGDKAALRAEMDKLFASDCLFHMCAPFGDFTGVDAFFDTVITPLFDAMPDLERRDFIIMAGPTEHGDDWLGCGGNFIGTFAAPFLDIPPTGHLAHMRFHEFYKFENAHFLSIIGDFNRFQEVLKKIRGGKQFKCLLTVSPVPLTATASGKHVLQSSIYSKSILRAVAGQLSANQAHIDYFPSYEIVTNPRMLSVAFADNLRSVRDETINTVMKHFFAEYPAIQGKIKNHQSAKVSIKTEADIQCEEALLEAFRK